MQTMGADPFAGQPDFCSLSHLFRQILPPFQWLMITSRQLAS
jgi:hypothetical protein